jgi:hypothetical protein
MATPGAIGKVNAAAFQSKRLCICAFILVRLKMSALMTLPGRDRFIH